MKNKAILIIAGALAFAGCESAQQEALKRTAITILGKVAVAQVQAAVDTELNGGDYAHSAAGAVWTAIDANDVAQLINDATGDKAPRLAHLAGSIAVSAVQKGFSTKDVVNAVASAISASTVQKPP